MVEVFRSQLPAPSDEAGVFVIHCSDPRFQPHFQAFLTSHLGLKRYGLLAVPGGVQVLTLTTLLPKFAWVGWRWLKFMGQVMQPTRLVLIAHRDCRWYVNIHGDCPAPHLRDREVSDLRGVCTQLKELFKNPRIELYFATLHKGEATFTRISSQA